MINFFCMIQQTKTVEGNIKYKQADIIAAFAVG